MMQNQKTSDAMLFHDYQGYGHGCSYIEVQFVPFVQDWRVVFLLPFLFLILDLRSIISLHPPTYDSSICFD